MRNIELLSKLCKVAGAPGYEHRVRELVKSEIEDLVDEMKVDALGNLIAIKKGASDKTVMIAAHMDEIGFIVTHVDKDGFVRFHTLGGFDPKTLTAQRVLIHGREDVLGVMGTKPIHLMSPEERSKAPKIGDYFIDTGLPKEEVEKLVRIGDTITRERELVELGDCVNSKSLDNRVSVFILIEMLRALKDKQTDITILATFTVQEEVGLRGAITSASGYDPDFGIALDVTLAYDLPGASPHEFVSELGKGAAIKVMDGMTICDSRMVEFMRATAEDRKIKHQMEVLPAGGTDTAGIQRSSKGGAIAGAISIPTRYLHQVIETAHKSDIEDCIELLIACVEDMTIFDWSI